MKDSGTFCSVEIQSREDVKTLSMSDRSHESVLFEFNLGELVSLALIDGEMIEIEGVNGFLRIELNDELLQQLLETPKRVLNLSSEMGSYTSTKKKGENN